LLDQAIGARTAYIIGYISNVELLLRALVSGHPDFTETSKNVTTPTKWGDILKKIKSELAGIEGLPRDFWSEVERRLLPLIPNVTTCHQAALERRGNGEIDDAWLAKGLTFSELRDISAKLLSLDRQAIEGLAVVGKERNEVAHFRAIPHERFVELIHHSVRALRKISECMQARLEGISADSINASRP